jgi:ribonucleoside-diphosphate reductase alpha chain
MKQQYLGIEIDLSKDSKYDEFPMELLKKHYLKPNEPSPQYAFARAATNFCYGDYEFAQRMYGYVSDQLACFSSPIISNSVAGTWSEKVENWNYTQEDVERRKGAFTTTENIRAMPISCFITMIPDSLSGQIEAAKELAHLSTVGGGVGQYLGMRGITEKSPGAIPYLKTMDSNILYYHQAGTRRGTVAGYLDITHPDLIEFLGSRVPSGGSDLNRKAFNVNNAVNITYEFLDAVAQDSDWNLIDPYSKVVVHTVKARELWHEILETRFLTGEPYIHNVDESNERLHPALKAKGFSVKASNICTEITLIIDELHTAICCLLSINGEKFDEWKDTQIIEDCTRFLDNVLQWFIDYAQPELHKAVRSARNSRDIGLGFMGWHNFLMKKKIPFESGGVGSAAQWAYQISKLIDDRSLEASKQLAAERGEPEYLVGYGVRNAHRIAYAPNANSSIICQTSASIEAIRANIYVHRTRIGSYTVKNKFLEEDIIRIAAEKNLNVNDIWLSILQNNGSIQGMDDVFTPEEQKLYKIATEIDQRYVIDQARIRQEFIDQACSVNVYLNEGVSRRELNQIHLRAFSREPELPGKPLKTLYYLRANKNSTFETVSGKIQRTALKDYESQEVDKTECTSCHA